MSDGKFRAGAGKAEMLFPAEAFPTAREDYVGIHDNPHVRVLILDGIKRYVIYNIEIVNVFPDTRERIVNVLMEKTKVLPENIWFHNCHVLSTPHAWKVDTSVQEKGPGKRPPHKFQRTPQQQKSVELVSDTVVNATAAAAEMAMQSLQPALVGCGMGYCAANANRNLETADGWWVSCNDEGPVDHRVPILRIDNENGEPIAVLFGFHAQPAVLDMVFQKAGGRLVSGDIAGYSTEFIEQEYPSAIAMYFTGAGGDGTPYFRGDYYLRGRGGKRLDRKLYEKAYLLAELTGERLGQQVIMAMERIHANDSNPKIDIRMQMAALPALKRESSGPGRPENPTRTHSFQEEGTKEIPLNVMQIGEMGFLGLIPEIGQTTAMEIEDSSPFTVTMVSTFTNSGPREIGGGKYMAEASYYDKVTFQALNSMFAKGAAEKMAERAIDMLTEMKES